MVAPAFQDLSNVLQPLPKIGSGIASSAPLVQASSTKPDFRETLKTALHGTTRTASKSANEPFKTKSNGSKAAASTEESADSARSSELMKACKDLEGFFMAMLLRSMNSKPTGDGVFGQSFEGSIYQDMFYSEVSKSVAEKGRSMGIADMIFNDIMLKTPDRL